MSDYSNVIQGMFSNGPKAAVAANINVNPDDSARAYELEKATGVPSSIISGDMESFEAQHKAAVAGDIVSGNPYIGEYVNSHPLASQVSNDDYGTLDTISQHLQGLPLTKAAFDTVRGALGSFGEDFTHGFDDVSQDEFENHPLRASVEAGLHTMVGLGNTALGLPLDVLAKGAGNIGTAITGDPEFGANVTEKLTNATDAAFMGAISSGLPVAEILGMGGESVLQKASMWLKEGKLPPAGISPEIDAIKLKSNQDTLSVLDQAVKEAQSSTTKERAPDLFANFVEQHVQDRRMAVSGQRALELYGDKVPEPDDGILGWVPDIDKQLEVARDTGADISIPMKDWIANVDPAVHKELADDLRVVDGGITNREATEALPPVPSIDEAVPTLRNSASLEPLFSIGDRKLTLNRLGATSKLSMGFGPEEGFHDFDMQNENGQSVGTLNLSEQKGGKELYVDNIQGEGDYFHPNNFGPSLMRDLLRQIKAAFPNAETLTGHRVSGARGEAGSYMDKLAFPKIRLEEAFNDLTDTHDKFSNILGGAWNNIGYGLEANVKPTALFTQHEQELNAAVEAERQRIAPRDTIVAPVSEIRRTGKATGPTGLYYPSSNANKPVILYALNSPDSLGTFRHEVVHDLWGRNFFTPKEKELLTSTSHAEGWQDKFQIGRRYAGKSDAIKLEESVADAYKAWEPEFEKRKQQANFSLSPIDQIFSKIKDFLDSVKAHIRRITGTENVDDLFQKVSSGEVRDRGPGDIEEREEASADEGPEPANDPDASGMQRGGTYNIAARDQKINRLVGPDTERGDTQYWRKIAEQEGHLVTGKPNGVRAARVHSEGGKTTLHIKDDGQRTVFQNGEKVARDLREGSPYASEAPISEPGQGIDVNMPFKAAKDVGMKLERFQLYRKTIEAQQQADLRAVTARVQREQTKRQSDEWKAQGEAMRPQVISDLNARPDIAADKFFGLGELMGKKLDKTYRLDWDALTPEQRKAIPESYTVRKGGVKPDDVANLFGYSTGDQMIDGLSKVTQARDASGLRRDRFQRKMADNEIQRRMETEHGYLEKNILEDTKDQVLSETQMQLLHQETMHLAQMAGENSVQGLTLDGITSAIKEKFDALPMGAVSSDKFLKEVGKQGKLAELSLLQGKAKEAFIAKQAQQHSAIYAKFAQGIEKAKAKLDKAAKPFRKQDVKNIEPEYLNHIQNLLSQAGYRVGRSEGNIAENLGRRGQTLEEFVNAKLSESNGMRDIPIADIITDNKVKPIDQMSTHDFMGFKQSVDALIKNAKDEQKIYRAGDTADRQAVLDEMVKDIKTFDLQPLKATAGKFDKALHFPGTMLAAVTNVETFLNRLGRRDPKSAFNKYIIYPAFEAAGNKFRIGNEIAKEVKDIGEFANPNKTVTPPFAGPDGRPFLNFTRRNVWGMLQHAGNKSNWEAFAKGWGHDPQALMTWLENNTTPEDWKFMQSFGDRVFGNIIKKADGVYERLNGVTIDKIPLTQFANKHGTFDGWYSPKIADLDYSGKSPLRMGGYDDSDFGHISTSNGYTMKRTGALYPMTMDPSLTMTRINQMIHDVAYREFILNAQKLFKDSRLNDAISAHYGKDYNAKNFLIPWLEDLAGQESTPAKAISEAGKVAEGLRQNIISTYIGFNPGTVLKHGPTAWAYSMKSVGPANFLRAARDLYLRGDSINMKNHEYIMDLSNELPMRERFWEDTIAGQYSRLEQVHGLVNIRRQVQQYGALAVAKSDIASAKPTFLAAFRDAQENMDMSVGDARDYADAKVREAHGSIAGPNLPAAVRQSGAMGRFYTSLYGFFGTTMQRRIEFAHDVNDAYKFMKQKDYAGAMNKSGSAFTNFMTYWVIPTAIEEGVTGLTTDDHRGLGTHLLAASFLGLSSTLLFVRDIVHGIESGHATGTGLLDSAIGEFSHGLEAPFKHDAWTRARAGKTVADTLTAFGLATGVAPKTVDNAAKFGIDLVNGQAHPKSVGDWYRGLVRGTTKERVEK